MSVAMNASIGVQAPRSAANPIRVRKSAIVLATFCLFVLTALASLFFRPIFEAWAFLVPPVLGALVVAAVVALLVDSFELRSGDGLLIQVIAAVLTLPGLMGMPSTKYGLPTLRSIGELIDALVQGPAKLLTVSLPARSGQELLAAPIGVAWLGFVIGWVVLRTFRTGWSVTGPILTLVVALSFGPLKSDYVAIVSVLFAVAAMVYLVVVGRLMAGGHGGTQKLAPRRIPVMPIVILGGVILASAVVGPQLNHLHERDRFTLRSYSVPPFDPGDLPSPLAEFRKFTTPAVQNKLLFSVKGDVPDRWRLAVLPSYDGRVWSVGSAKETIGGSFELVGARLHKSTDFAKGAASASVVTIENLSEPWLPLPGPGLKVSMPKQARSAVRFDTTATATRWCCLV